MMTEMIAIYQDSNAAAAATSAAAAVLSAGAAVAVTVTETREPAVAQWGRQRQFGMSFEEQQEIIYQALVAFQDPEQQ